MLQQQLQENEISKKRKKTRKVVENGFVVVVVFVLYECDCCNVINIYFIVLCLTGIKIQFN